MLKVSVCLLSLQVLDEYRKVSAVVHCISYQTLICVVLLDESYCMKQTKYILVYVQLTFYYIVDFSRLSVSHFLLRISFVLVLSRASKKKVL